MYRPDLLEEADISEKEKAWLSQNLKLEGDS